MVEVWLFVVPSGNGTAQYNGPAGDILECAGAMTDR